MDFGTLKSRLLAQIGRAPSDMCYELVTSEINSSLRLATMLSSSDLVEAATITLPTDFLEASNVYLDTDPVRSLRPSSNAVLQRDGAQGLATEYSIYNGEMVLDRVSGGGETVKLEYYAKLDDLSADTDTNAILTRYPAIYIYGVLAHHAALIRSPEALSVHFPAYERSIGVAKADDNRKRMGGVVPRIKVAATP